MLFYLSENVFIVLLIIIKNTVIKTVLQWPILKPHGFLNIQAGAQSKSIFKKHVKIKFL